MNLKYKIIHITSAHSRYDTRIFYKQLRSLSKNGFDVTLLVNDKMPDEIVDGIRIISSNKSFTRKVSRFIYSNTKMIFKVIKTNYDVYQIHDPDLIPLLLILKFLNKSVIYDSHENYQKLIKNKISNRMIRYLFTPLFYFLENSLVKISNHVLVANYDVLHKFVRLNRNVSLIPNYPIIDDLMGPKFSKLKMESRKDKMVVCFAGGIVPEWCHEIIVSTISKMENVEYHIAGFETQYLRELKLSDYPNIHYVGELSKKEVAELYIKSDVGIGISNLSQLMIEGTIGNTKLLEYMSYGLPVIANNNKIWAEIIGSSNSGILLDNLSQDSLKTAIDFFKVNSEIRKDMGVNAFNTVIDKYNWSLTEKNLIEIYTQVIKESKD